MSEPKFTIFAKYLRAALVVAPKDDIRGYLCGVLLETGPRGARLISSDGRVMAVSAPFADALSATRVVIPRWLVRAALRLERPEKVCITVDGDKVTIAAGGRHVTGEAMDATPWPDWRKFWRHEAGSGVPCVVAPWYQQMIWDYFAALGHYAGHLVPSVDWNGTDKALIATVDGERAALLVMPMKPSGPVDMTMLESLGRPVADGAQS